MTSIIILSQAQAPTTLLQVGAGVQGPPGPPGPPGAGAQGPPGPPGAGAAISTDPDNRLTVGADSGLFVPEITADPLAYYILSKG